LNPHLQWSPRTPLFARGSFLARPLASRCHVGRPRRTESAPERKHSQITSRRRRPSQKRAQPRPCAHLRELMPVNKFGPRLLGLSR
jgi:hypothetical protein